MALGFKATIANSLLDALVNASAYTGPSNLYVKLHTGSPGAAGTSNAAGNTTRKEATFGAASSGTALNDNTISWTNVSTSETYSHCSVWDDVSAGNFIAAGTITANAVTSGDTFTIAIGSVSLSLNVAA